MPAGLFQNAMFTAQRGPGPAALRRLDAAFSRFFGRLFLLPALLLAVSPAALGSDRAITDVVPANSLVVYTAKPYGETGKAKAASTQPAASDWSIATILAFLNAGGMIPDEGQVFADIVTALPLLGRHEHAVVLLDVSSRVLGKPGASDDPRAASLRLKQLQSAVILRTNGRHQEALTHLNRIVGRYTNAEVARLTTQEIEGHSYQRLIDERLVGWAVWEWGPLGEFFVLSFGTGAFEKIAHTYAGKTPSLSKDPWFREATLQTQGDRARAQWFIAMERLGQRLGPAVHGRFSSVTKALDAGNMTHDLWTIGQQGRALSWYRCYRRNGRDYTHRYSDPAAYLPRHRRIIPQEARHYAIIHVPTRWLVDNLPRAWVASQSEHNIQKWSRIWRRLEAETGIDINGSLIDHLGDTIAICDYPPHPLKIPFALTVAIEIDDRDAVRHAVDTLLGAWGRYLDDRAERKGTRLVRVKVRLASDGIWYLQAGILGPALKVTDRYLVISWSPQALRDALVFIERRSRDG